MSRMNRTGRLGLALCVIALASCGGDRYLQLQTRRVPMPRDVSFGDEIRELPWKPPGLKTHLPHNPHNIGPKFKDDLPIDQEDRPGDVHYHVEYYEPAGE